MAHTLSITDGTTTVTLSSGNQYLSRYTPETAWNNEDVSERVMVGFTGATITDALTTLRTISTLFEQARRWDKYKTGPRVFINFDPGATGTAYRSLLRGGNLNLNEKTLKEHWGGRNLELELEWTRQGFWEGPETALSMTSFATALNTTVSIMNKSDSDGGNYVTIASTDIVLGDMPSPMKLTITDTTPLALMSMDMYEVYIFHNVDSNPETFTHILEGESSSDVSGTASTDCSNGSYAALSWATTTDTFLCSWNISNTQVDAMAGGRFVVVMAGPPSSGETKYVSIKIANTNAYGNPYYAGPKAQENKYFRGPTIIDTIRIPQALQSTTTYSGVRLELWGFSPTTDTHTIPLDFLLLGPVSSDGGWMRIKSALGGAEGITLNEKFVVNEYDDAVYVERSSQKSAELTLYGGPILLVPNKTQRLYFMISAYQGTLRWSTANINISYRPRYRVL